MKKLILLALFATSAHAGTVSVQSNPAISYTWDNGVYTTIYPKSRNTESNHFYDNSLGLEKQYDQETSVSFAVSAGYIFYDTLKVGAVLGKQKDNWTSTTVFGTTEHHSDKWTPSIEFGVMHQFDAVRVEAGYNVLLKQASIGLGWKF